MKVLICGASGILVPPEDPDIVEQALRISIIDDDLVNKAAEQNYAVIKEKLDCYELKIEAYGSRFL